MQAELAYHEGMAQQIAIDGALLDGQAETRGENIFKLHPQEFGVQLFVLACFRSRKRSGSIEILDSTGICHPLFFAISVIPSQCFRAVREAMTANTPSVSSRTK